MEENKQLPELPTLPEGKVTVCDIRFHSGTKTYYFDPNGLTLKEGDHVIIETARGAEYGTCSSGAHAVCARRIVPPLRKVLRIATQQDEYVNEQNRKLEKLAFQTCQQKIEQLGLEMQLVSCECAFDGSKLLFFFTADGRVDFRELVKLLASNFHTRIELRQIGVRDKAKMVGGLGICGQPFCCGQFLSDFAPVSIKMAKTQNLSLNPTKISGTCGRLMCCLKYEQDTYEDLLKSSPKVESFVDTPDGRGTITNVNLMHQTVTVRMEKDPDEQHSYRSDEIAVLRSGRAKKTDEPIPDDLAPISGKKAQQPAPEVYPRFVQNRPQTAEPAAADAPAAAEQPSAGKGRRRRERRAPEQSAAAAPAETQPVKTEAQPVGAEQPSASKKRRGSRGKHRARNENAAPQPETAPSAPSNGTPAHDAAVNGKTHRGKSKHKGEAAPKEAQKAAHANHPAQKTAPKLAVPLMQEPKPAHAEKNARHAHAEPSAHAEKPAHTEKSAQKPQNGDPSADAQKKKRRRYYHHNKKS